MLAVAMIALSGIVFEIITYEVSNELDSKSFILKIKINEAEKWQVNCHCQ